MENALVSWSSGKDSALALYYVLQQKKFNPIGLLTTISGESKRIDFHELSESLLEKQAESLGLPLHKIHLPPNCTNVIYESTLCKNLAPFLNKEISHIIFGDLFLADIRKYRETFLASIPLQAVFPLWGYQLRSCLWKLSNLDLKRS